MHRRTFFGLTLAAAALPATRGWATEPWPSPDSGATISSLLDAVATPPASGNLAFDTWLTSFIARAIGAGWPQDLLTREMSGLVPDARILALDGRQPELSKPVGDYIRKAVSADRVAIGQARMRSLSVWQAIETRFGVPREILGAIWGMETGYGASMGDFDVMRSMATLAAEGRRQAWAESQIFSALRILAIGQVRRDQLKGSWAGAMGQTQFLPETYVTSAVDFDGDGKRDIWGSSADALASAANLLVKGGWRRGEPWAREVLLPPGFDYGLSEGPVQTPTIWATIGVRPAPRPTPELGVDTDWTPAELAARASLILPAGWTGPAFLIFANHMAIRTYNNSTAYALGVGLLADGLSAKPGLVTPWPIESSLSLAERQRAQSALNRLGYTVGDVDGVVGIRTRKALRLWQATMGRPADGYLTGDLILALEAASWGMPAAGPASETPSNLGQTLFSAPRP